MTNQTPLTALQVMQDAPVIPVIVLNDISHAVPMARALLAEHEVQNLQFAAPPTQTWSVGLDMTSSLQSYTYI